MSDNKDQVNGRENSSDNQPCCDGGCCCSSDSDTNGKTAKLVVFILIVVAAGTVLAHSFIEKSNPDTNQPQQTFAAIQIDDVAEVTVKSEAKIETPPVAVETKKQDSLVKAASALWKADLDSLASLNKVAVDADVVFVLLAAKDLLNDLAITKEIESAAQKIMADKTNVSAFRLKETAPEYAKLAKQISVPSVLAMVKGRGVNTVSNDITETKLVQAFVAASRPSGCGPGGCGPGGCK